MASKENTCKNFAANIFDKNKCQNCFKPRDTHIHLTKDLTKAKPIYYGWLLLAPIGTDFTNMGHKNRKWQRRWFVLFEHGQLRYALDDNASTVAQSTIDMNQSNDVEYADDITEQKHTLCITMNNNQDNYYLRAGNKEEIIGWRDALIVFPETIKEDLRRKNKAKNRRSDFARHSDDGVGLPRAKSRERSKTLSSYDDHHHHDVIVDDQQENRPPPSSILMNKSADPHHKPTIDYSSSTSSLDSSATFSNTESDNRSKMRSSKLRSTSEMTSLTIDEIPPRTPDGQTTNVKQKLDKSNSYPRSRPSKRRDRPKSYISQTNTHKEIEEEMMTSAITTSSTNTPTVDKHQRGRNISRRSTQAKQGTQSNKKSSALTSSTSASDMRRAKSLDRRTYHQIVVSPDLFNVKNGFLTIISDDDVWTKHWVVLSNNTIKYYKDTSSEYSSQAEGTIDLTNFQDVYEIDVERSHGFQIVTSEGKYKLVAVTSGIRQGWINAILRSTNSQKIRSDADSKTANNESSSAEGHLRSSAEDSSSGQRPQQIEGSSTSGRKSRDGELSHAERTARRKQRIRDRKRDGRARTFDFAEMRKAENAKKREESELVRKLSYNKEDSDEEKRKLKQRNEEENSIYNRMSTRQSNLIHESNSKFESAWKKIENIDYDVIRGRDGAAKNPLCETANIVKSLQNEIDSLKIQIEKVQEVDTSLYNKDEINISYVTTQDYDVIKTNEHEPIKVEENQQKSCEVDERLLVDVGSGMNEVKGSEITEGHGNFALQLQMVEDELKMKKKEVDHYIRENSILRKRLDSKPECEKETQSFDPQSSKNSSNPFEELNKDNSHVSSQSTFTEKLSELEAEMGGTEQLILAARMNAATVETSNSCKSSTSSTTENEKNSHFIKIQQAQNDLAQHSEQITKVQQQFQQFQLKQQQESREKWRQLQRCFRHLEKTTRNMMEGDFPQLKILHAIVDDIIKVTSPHNTDDDVTYDVTRKLQLLAERLESGDSSGVTTTSLLNDTTTTTTTSEEEAIFIKQISTQALLLAEMSSVLKKIETTTTTTTPTSSTTPAVIPTRSQEQLIASSGNFNHFNQELPSFLENVEDLVKKLKLGGKLMKEINKIRETQQQNTARNTSGNNKNDFKATDYGNIGIALATHAQISYTLQVYNERISRLSHDLGQSRHKANACMRKLVELVDACKMKDLEQVSQLAVQVDIDCITSSYPELSPLQQQIDYGQLHGASSVDPSTSSTMTSSSQSSSDHLQNESDFFHHLAQDLSTMACDFNTLIKMAAQVIEKDQIIQKYSKKNFESLSSTIAMEALIQSEIIYVAHRLRCDYEHELQKVKNLSEENVKIKTEKYQDTIKLMKIQEEKLKKEVAEANNKLQNLTGFREDLLKESEEKLKKKQETYEKEIVRIKSELNSEIARIEEKYRKEKETEYKNYQQEINIIKQKKANSIEECARKLEIMKENLAKKLKEKVDLHKKEVENIKANHQKQMKQNKEEIAEQNEKLRKSYSDKLKEEKTKILDQQREAMENLNTEILHLKREKDEREKSFQKTLEKELQEMRGKCERKISEYEKEMQEKWNSEMEQTRLEHERELREEIMQLQDELNTKEGQLSNSWREMEELGNESYHTIKTTHQKQMDNLRTTHERELFNIREEHRIMMENDKEDTRRAIEIMHKFHQEQLDALKSNAGDGDSNNESGNSNQQLKDELEAISEQFSRKCIQLETCMDEEVKTKEEIENYKRENERLRKKIEEINKIYSCEEKENSELAQTSEGKSPTDRIYQLQMQLRVKTSEVEYLEETNSSLIKELDEQYHEIQTNKKQHEKMLEEMEMAKSKEKSLKREINRLQNEGLLTTIGSSTA